MRDALPETSVRCGEAGMDRGAIQVELFFESSTPLWNRKWNLPSNLKSHLYFGVTHLRGPG